MPDTQVCQGLDFGNLSLSDKWQFRDRLECGCLCTINYYIVPKRRKDVNWQIFNKIPEFPLGFKAGVQDYYISNNTCYIQASHNADLPAPVLNLVSVKTFPQCRTRSDAYWWDDLWWEKLGKHFSPDLRSESTRGSGRQWRPTDYHCVAFPYQSFVCVIILTARGGRQRFRTVGTLTQPIRAQQDLKMADIICFMWQIQKHVDSGVFSWLIEVTLKQQRLYIFLHERLWCVQWCHQLNLNVKLRALSFKSWVMR